jgi:hypothetical protein
MKQDQIEEGKISSNSKGLGTVTEEMVRQRAREIALINGRAADQYNNSDLEVARREFLGEQPPPPEGAAEDALPESERWDPVRGSIGRKAGVVPAHDEQTDAEKLVEEGVFEAEHDQMVEGTKDSLRREKS